MDKIVFYEERDFSAKLSATIDFVRQNFLSLAKSILFIAGPASLIFGIALTEYMKTVFRLGYGEGRGSNELAELAPFGISYFFLILASSLAGIFVISTTYSYMKLYNERETDDKIEVSEVFKLVGQNFFKLLGLTVLVSLMLIVSFLLFVIPGIYISVVVSFVFAVAIFEKIDIVSAIGRCFKLIKGKWLSTLGILFVTYFIASLISGLFAIPYYIISFAQLFTNISNQEFIYSEPSLLYRIFEIVASTVLALGSYISAVIPLIALAFQYFNLVERQESRGLMSQIENID
ncbi:MAG: hypothetical protein AAF363_17005 [Bacteroidota bacterium]